MRTTIEHLLALQKLVLPSASSAPERQARIDELRKLVPPPVLTHFDRMVSHGRKGVALVRHGVCSECHIRVPVGTLASLVAPNDVYLCDICGCYLLLPLEEVPAATNPSKPRPVARRARSKNTLPAPLPAVP